MPSEIARIEAEALSARRGCSRRRPGRGLRLALTGAMLLGAGCEGEPVGSFSELDRDGDSRISRNEATADASLGQRFSEYDANRDGELSAREYVQAAARTR